MPKYPVINGVQLIGSRQVCLNTAAGNREYHMRIQAMWDRQQGMCCVCGHPMPLERATFEHENGRGMGGGKRTDAIWNEDGSPLNGVSHFKCNKLRGSTNSPLLYREQK